MKSHLTIVPTAGMSREDWLAYRHSGIGASEVGAILGLDDYTSSLELFYYKCGETSRFDVQSMAAFMGINLQDLAADLWQHWDGTADGMIANFQAGRIVRKCRRVNSFIRNPRYPWLYVSLDRVINKHAGKEEGTLEIKTIGGWESDKWEAGLPPKYVTQVQTQMLVPEFEYGEMAVLQDGRIFDVLPFEPSADIMNHIVTRTKDFWDRVVYASRLVNEKYDALRTHNQRQVDLCNKKIDELAPEPDGSLAYDSYLKKRLNDPKLAERRGTDTELELAQLQASYTEQLKELERLKLVQEDKLKQALGNHQVLDFGRSGRVYWTKMANGGRNFRNKVKV